MSGATLTPVNTSPEPGAAIARSAFHLVIGQVFTTGLAIAFSAAVGRALGPEDFSIWYVVLTTGTFAFVVAEWGQGQSVVRDVARQPSRSGELLGGALLLRLLGTVPVTAVVLVAGWLLDYGERTLGLLALFMLTWLPFFLSQAYAMVFRGRERMDLDAQLSVLFKALVLVFSLAALALGGKVAGILFAQGAAGLVCLAVATLRGRQLGIPLARTTRAVCQEIAREGVPVLAISLAVTVQPYIDAIVLTRLVPKTQVGWYGAARNVMGTLVAPATILGAAAFPRLSRAAAEPAQFQREFRVALRPLLGLGALAAVGTYLFADVAVSIIYGNRGFGPAALILQAFAPALFLVCVDMLFGGAVLAIGRPKALAAAKAANVILCTGLSFLLIPWAVRTLGNGGVGLVLAFGASEGVMFVAAAWLLPRGTLGASFIGDVLRSLAAAALTLALFYVLPPITPWLGIPLCIATFIGAAVAVRLFTREEARAFSAALLKKRGAPAVEPGGDA